MDTQEKLRVARSLYDDKEYAEYEELLIASDENRLRATRRTRFSDMSFQVSKHAKKLNESKITTESQGGPVNRTTLDDGLVVEWFSELIPAATVKDMTYIVESNNGRSQSLLNEQNLSLMTYTISKNCQFYPAYGVRQQDGRIEIIDGSRRRMSCIFGGTDFSVYVTDTLLTPDQIKSLRVILQSAREAALYDVGMDCMSLKGEGLNGKEIAKFLNISESKVSRAKVAAQAPLAFMKLFDDYSVLSLADYKQLVDLKNSLVESNGEEILLDGSEFLSQVSDAISLVPSIEDGEEQAKEILSQLKKAAKKFTSLHVSADKIKVRPTNLLSQSKTDHRINTSIKRDKKGNEKEVFELVRMDAKTREKFRELVNKFIDENYSS